MNRTVILATLALAATACHGSESSTLASDAAPASPAASHTQTPATSYAPVDVCALLSAADMAQASGRPIVKAEKGTLGECTYESKEAIRLEYIVRVVVRDGIHIGGSKQDAKNYMNGMRAMDTVHRLTPAVDVPGLGDDATIVGSSEPKAPRDFDTIVLLARKGDSIVEMIHGRGVDPQRVVDTAKSALPSVLAVL
jgi:hypothetical protein